MCARSGTCAVGSITETLAGVSLLSEVCSKSLQSTCTCFSAKILWLMSTHVQLLGSMLDAGIQQSFLTAVSLPHADTFCAAAGGETQIYFVMFVLISIDFRSMGAVKVQRNIADVARVGGCVKVNHFSSYPGIVKYCWRMELCNFAGSRILYILSAKCVHRKVVK